MRSWASIRMVDMMVVDVLAFETDRLHYEDDSQVTV